MRDGSASAHRVIAFGNNVGGCLVENGPSALQQPTNLDVECDRILWHSWTCSIVQEVDGCYRSWGVGAPSSTDFSDVKRIIGFDTPLATLRRDGHVSAFDDTVSLDSWSDVVITGLGIVFASNDIGVYRFDTLQDLFTIPGAPIPHPLLNHTSKLYATESRCLVHSGHHLLELVDTRSLPPSHGKTDCPVVVSLLEEFEGLGIKTVTPGSANRFGVITDAGEGWVVGRECEALEFEDEIRDLGVGSNFELVLTETGLYSRGADEYGQLGVKGNPRSFTRIPVDDVVAIHTARWSSLVVSR